MPSQAQLLQKADEISKRPGNNICSECPERHPTWASLLTPALPGGELMGVFICHKCYKHHFEIGMKYCEVKSISMATEWSRTDVETLAKTGNKVVNSIYEANMDDWDNDKEIVTFDKEEEAQARGAFVRNKYQKRKYFSETKYHAVMSKLNPNYGQNQEPPASDRPRRRPSLTTASSLIPDTPGRVQQRGSVGVYSTSPKKPQQEVAQTPKRKPIASENGDRKSQLGPATSQARQLLGLPIIHRTPSRRSMLANQRTSSLRNVLHGEKSTRAPSLLGHEGDSTHDRDRMQLPNDLQMRGRAPILPLSEDLRKSYSDRNLAKQSAEDGHGTDKLNRLRQASLMGASTPSSRRNLMGDSRRSSSRRNLMETSSSDRNLAAACSGGMYSDTTKGQDNLLSTPGGGGGRRSMMVKSASTRSMRGAGLLQDTRKSATATRDPPTRGKRTMGEASTRQRRSSLGREPSTQDRQSSPDHEINWEDRRNSQSKALSVRRSNSSKGKQDSLRHSSHNTKSGRAGRQSDSRKGNSKTNLNDVRTSSHDKSHSPNLKQRGRISRQSMESNSDSDSCTSEFGEDRRHDAGLKRNTSRGSLSKPSRQHSGSNLNGSNSKKLSRQDSKQGKKIPARSKSQNRNTSEERRAYVSKKQSRSSSSRNATSSLSFDDLDDSESDAEEHPGHNWKKPSSSGDLTKAQRTRPSCDEERKPDRRSMMKKQPSIRRRSMRRLPSGPNDDAGDGSKCNSNEKKLDGRQARRSGPHKLGRSKSVSTLQVNDSSSDEDDQRSHRCKLGSVNEDDAENKYKNLTGNVRASCSSGTLGLLRAGGLPDGKALDAYAGERGRRESKRKSKLSGKTKDLHGKYGKGLAKISSTGGLGIKSRCASTGALGLLTMQTEAVKNTPDVFAGFDQKVQDLLKKRAAAKKKSADGDSKDSPSKKSAVNDFQSDTYKNAMVAQWLVTQADKHKMHDRVEANL